MLVRKALWNQEETPMAIATKLILIIATLLLVTPSQARDDIQHTGKCLCACMAENREITTVVVSYSGLSCSSYNGATCQKSGDVATTGKTAACHYTEEPTGGIKPKGRTHVKPGGGAGIKQ
jgi:hypothetical protein